MIYPRKPIPDDGEILIATVKKVFDQGAYVTLDEYAGLEAYLPWIEVSSRWVRNIRDVLSEGRKIVVKVIRVDRKKGTVDVSLKKVTEDEKKKKMLQWKRLQRTDKILEIVSQKLKVSEKQAWEEVAWRLESKYNTDAFSALEKAIKEGDKVLRDAGVPEMWIKPLMEEVGKHIEEKRYKVFQIVTVRSSAPDGVERIKAFFNAVEEMFNEDVGELKIYTIGAPRYRVEIVGTNQAEIGAELTRLLKSMESLAKENDVSFAVVKK
ncbi:MAG: translation initiation factor IF-2 subunit alpha [Thermoprotei archaeon]